MENDLRQKLTMALEPDSLEIINDSTKHAGHIGSRHDGNTHFRIKIVSNAFVSLSRIKRHQLIHTILKTELEGPIHALSLTLLTPEEDQHDP